MKMTKMVRQVVTGAVAIGAMAALPGSAFAGPITGVLAIGGGITYDTVGTSGSAILDWSPSGGGSGVGLVVTSASGYFNPAGPPANAGIDFGTSFIIKDLTNDPALAAVAPFPAFAPAGAAADVPNFLHTFVDPDGGTTPIGGLHFDLTDLVVQAGTPCPLVAPFPPTGQSCVQGGIFVLTQTAEGLRINLDVLGFFRAMNTVTGSQDEGFFSGVFATTFVDMTFSEAFARLAAGQDLDCPDNGSGQPCGMTATFTNAQPIPEPASLLLFGTGSTLLALRRRRNSKNKK